MEGVPTKGGRGEIETMEFGKGKTAGTEELPPPTPPPQLPMAAAAAAAAVESLEVAATAAAAGGGGGGVTSRTTTNVLMRQTSIGSSNAASKNNNNNNCLCSPTTHAGSFRCRLHRSPPSSSLPQRTKSMDSSDSVAASTAPPNS